MKKYEDMDERISSMFYARMLIEMAIALEPEATIKIPDCVPVFRLLFAALNCIEHGAFNNELNEKTKRLLFMIENAAQLEEQSMQTGKLN